MDFGTLLQTAKENDGSKREARYYSTKFAPPKKEEKKAKNLSANIQKFLARKEAEEKQKTQAANRKRDELLALRSKDSKATRRVNVMLKRTKSANQSVIEDAVDRDNTAVTLAGPSQPDEDDYGYVSQEAAAYYNKMMEKYNKMPDDPKFPTSRKKASNNLNSTKDRVRAALEREKEEAMLPHRRKRKHKEEVEDHVNESQNYDSDDQERMEPPAKVKPKSSGPPPINFSELLKLAAQKQHEPVVIEVKPKDEEGPLLTKKQKREIEKERLRRETKLQNSQVPPARPTSQQTENRISKPPLVQQNGDRIKKASASQAPKSNEPRSNEKMPKPNVQNNYSNNVPKAKYPSAPPQNTKYPSAPSQNSRYPSAPPQNAKYQSGPPQNAKYQSGPSQNAKYPSAPPQNAKYQSASPQNAKYPSGPPQNAKYPSGPPQNSKYPSAPPQNSKIRDGYTNTSKIPNGEANMPRPRSGDMNSTRNSKPPPKPELSANKKEFYPNKPDPGKRKPFSDVPRKNQDMNPNPSKRSDPPRMEKKSVSSLPPKSMSGASAVQSSSRPNMDSQRRDLKLNGNSKQLDKSKQMPASSMRARELSSTNSQPKRFPPDDLKPKQFPPKDLKPKQFPPADVRRREFPPKDVRRKPQMGSKRRILDDDEEYDSEMDDFIDDGPEEEEDYSKYIKDIFGYDKSRYRGMEEDDIDNMESSFAQQMKEDVRSTKLGLMEDLEDIKREKEEKRRKAILKKKRKL